MSRLEGVFAVKIAAYLLLGDPRWLRESVLSYYDSVDLILAVCDRAHRAWDGSLLPVGRCIAELSDIDVAGKVVVVDGDLVDPGVHRMIQDTDARRFALSRLREYDWVLQLDADEVMTSPHTFLAALDRADLAGAGALDYPSRWILGQVEARWCRWAHLEACDALGRIAAHFPGPLAVRPGTHLNYSRRATTEYFRVDIRRHNTYHEYTRDHPVHMIVPPNEAVMHLSWVARDGYEEKSASQHGHWKEHMLDDSRRLAAQRLRRPARTVLTNWVRAGHGHPNRLRLTRLDLAASPPRFEPWPGRGLL